ncbi:hypothetical protein ES707_03655 [subsurface metagenome]
MYGQPEKLQSKVLAPQWLDKPKLKYHLRNYQPVKAGLAGFLLAPATLGRVYNNFTVNADETHCPPGPLTLRDTTVPNNANETKKLSLAAPSTLPDYLMEVCL